MKLSLLRQLARNFILSSSKYKPDHITSSNWFVAPTQNALRFYSNKYYPSRESKFEEDVSVDVGDRGSKEELTKRVQRFYDGDEEAIPSIFEEILKRKLYGKDDEDDAELIKEICGEGERAVYDVEDEEIDFKLGDELSESESESESESDVEEDGKTHGHR